MAKASGDTRVRVQAGASGASGARGSSRGRSNGGRSSADGRGRRIPWHSRSERTREVIALVLFGVAVFLLFALTATEKGGVVGRVVDTALVFAFGKLVLPRRSLIAAGVIAVLEWKFWRSLRFWGVLVFPFGLFLLMAGGVPPFGDHGGEYFVRAEFEAGAGGLGEVFTQPSTA